MLEISTNQKWAAWFRPMGSLRLSHVARSLMGQRRDSWKALIRHLYFVWLGKKSLQEKTESESLLCFKLVWSEVEWKKIFLWLKIEKVLRNDDPGKLYFHSYLKIIFSVYISLARRRCHSKKTALPICSLFFNNNRMSRPLILKVSFFFCCWVTNIFLRIHLKLDWTGYFDYFYLLSLFGNNNDSRIFSGW